MEGWIDIAEYASKYGVSTSTLRRRIRSNAIQFKMHRGKYLLEDSADAMKAAPLFARNLHSADLRNPTQTVRSAGARIGSTQSPEAALHDPVQDLLNSDKVLPVHMKDEFNKLEDENKRLKAEIAELQTLVKALEAEISP